MLQLSKNSQLQKIIGEITCELYSMINTEEWVGFRGRTFLLAQFEMLVMLYLHGGRARGAAIYDPSQVSEVPRV